MRELMKQLSANHMVSFAYTSGKQSVDAGDWEFQVYGLQGWRVEMDDWRVSASRFAVLLLSVDDHSTLFQSLFVSFARRLHALHGYSGHALVLWASRSNENEAFEAYLAGMLNVLDAGDLIQAAADAEKGIKTVSWLTAVNYATVKQFRGIGVLRSELPRGWFALYDYGDGVVVQAGPAPEGAPVESDGNPARLVLPNALFKPLRAPEVGMHTGSVNGEPRLAGWAAQQWLKRLDVEEEELMAYKNKLLGERKLTPATTLPERL